MKYITTKLRVLLFVGLVGQANYVMADASEFRMKIQYSSRSVEVYLYHLDNLSSPYRQATVDTAGDPNFHCDIADTDDISSTWAPITYATTYYLRVENRHALLRLDDAPEKTDFKLWFDGTNFEVVDDPAHIVHLGSTSYWNYQTVSFLADQRLYGSSVSVDSVGHWQGGPDFKAYLVPKQFTLFLGSSEILRAPQKLISQQKFEGWSNDDTVTNFRQFVISGEFPTQLISQFKGVNNGITIKTELIESPGTMNGEIQFRDPWYIDSLDDQFGLNWRNRGMANANYYTRSVENTGFKPDTCTVYTGSPYPYLGVLLNRDPEQTPVYYCVAAPNAQTISGIPSIFLEWTGSTDSVGYQNANACTTSVVFKLSGAIASARYKAHLRSTSIRSSGMNMQRTICYVNGRYHVVYLSAGDVWYLNSTDNGGNWSAETLLSDGSGLNRQPSIAVRQSRSGGQSYLAVIWERYDGEYSDITVRYLESNSTWGSASVIWNGLMDQDCEGATPSMALENTFDVAVWRVKTSSELYQSGLYLWMSTDSGPYVFDGSGTTSIHPSIAVPAFQDLERRFAVAWSDNGQIYYKPFRWYQQELTSSATESPSSGSGLSQHDYPSLVYVSSYARRPALAWQAYSTYIEANVVLARERGTSSWGTIQQYSRDESYMHPSLTRHEYPDTALVMAWHDGSNMYLAKRTTSWGSRTNLSSGRYPGLGLDPDGDNTHFRIVYTTGASAPYQIATTSQGLPKAGAGDLEMCRVVALSHGAAYAVVLEKAALVSNQGETDLPLRAVGDPGKEFTPEESSGMVSTTNFIVPRGARLRIEASSEGSNEIPSASHTGGAKCNRANHRCFDGGRACRCYA